MHGLFRQNALARPCVGCFTVCRPIGRLFFCEAETSDRMTSPYEKLSPDAFWRTAVVGQPFESIAGLYQKKFPISRSMPIATAGSCFAQHIARHLRKREFELIDAEPAPPGLDPDEARRFGFGLYSARYGNIYTARQLRQIAQEAFGAFQPADIVWQRNGRYFDALRPSVEPNGLASADAVLDHRAYHLRQIRKVIQSSGLFIFTLGLTEAWTHVQSGTTFPTAPGVIAGDFDPTIHRFHNFTFQEVYDDLLAFFDLARSENPTIRFLLTVSPVPLTATASGEHVLRATVYSKSVLRAVAGQLYQERADVEYFPSFEVVTSPLSKSAFFEENLRAVRPEGVEAAMNMFFAEHDDTSVQSRRDLEAMPALPPEHESVSDDEVVCEEVLLDAFAK